MDDFTETSSNYVEEIKEKSSSNVEQLNKLPKGKSVIEITECVKEAHQLIDQVIERSSKNIVENLAANTDVPNIEWLTIQQFTIDNGIKKIDEFIETWERRPNWLYCIDFLCEEIAKYSKRYRYKVQWSIPTRRKPIPRATASVYFTFDVSTVKQKDTMVQVYYIFESSKLVHRPGQSRFREKWLKDIIDAKVILVESIMF